MHAVAKAALKNRRKLFNVVAKAVARTKHIMLARTQISHANVYLGDLFLKKNKENEEVRMETTKIPYYTFSLSVTFHKLKKRRRSSALPVVFNYFCALPPNLQIEILIGAFLRKVILYSEYFALLHVPLRV